MQKDKTYILYVEGATLNLYGGKGGRFDPPSGMHEESE
jgi:hypothetical protein